MKSINISNYKTLGEYIRFNRLLLGITQKETVESLSKPISKATLINIEKKNSDPRFSNAVEILKFLRDRGAPAIDLYQLD